MLTSENRIPGCPQIQIKDTWGTLFTIRFDHFDVGGEDWIEVFKLIMMFLGFHENTIKELFNETEEE